jgi:hypothetical protein
MKILYANGDSWSAGDEFSIDNPMDQIKRYYSTWPSVLANQMQIPIIVNESLAGGNNYRIYRKTKEFIFSYIGKNKNPEELCIVIGWTTPERNEVYLNGAYHSLTVNNEFYMQIKDYATYKKIFYSHLDDTECIKSQVSQMQSLRMICNGLGIKYYDFIALGYDPNVYNSASIEHYNLPLKNLYLKNTWHKYVHDNNHPLHPNRHPTIETNKLWAELLYNELI